MYRNVSVVTIETMLGITIEEETIGKAYEKDELDVQSRKQYSIPSLLNAPAGFVSCDQNITYPMEFYY